MELPSNGDPMIITVFKLSQHAHSFRKGVMPYGNFRRHLRWDASPASSNRQTVDSKLIANFFSLKHWLSNLSIAPNNQCFDKLSFRRLSLDSQGNIIYDTNLKPESENGRLFQAVDIIQSRMDNERCT